MPVPIVREYQIFQGIRYFAEGGYWRASRGGPGRGALLHHAIWRAVHGAIPDGYEIHHRDGNGRNNAIENLECVTRKQHTAKHPPKGYTAWARAERSRRRKAEWARRTARAYSCLVCGGPFESRGQHPAYCSPGCRKVDYQRRTRDRTVANLEPYPRGRARVSR